MSRDSLIGAMLSDKRAVKGKKKEEAAVSKEPDFVIMDTGDIFEARIQINNNDIKKFMINSDSDMVSLGHIIEDEIKDRDLLLVRSRFNIFDMVNDGHQNGWIDRNYNNLFMSFLAVLKDYEEKFEESFKNADKDVKIPFKALPYVLTKGMEISMMDKETPISFVLEEASIQSTWFGVFLKIEGQIIVSNGKKFLPGEFLSKIGMYEGDKSLSDLGIKDLAYYPELREALILRGKKYYELNSGGPKYCSYTGAAIRRGYWFDAQFPSTGRIMIDRLGMMNIDPNYDKYYGSSRNYNEDIESLDDELSNFSTITDQQYLIASPYCYGFSLTSKQWVEFNIEKISDIQFRTDAYSKLVLDSELKDIMFSLVEYQGEGKDIIDNKGGGCIFLLHGAPGVGK